MGDQSVRSPGSILDGINAYAPRYWLTWVGLAAWRLICKLPLPMLWALGSIFGDLLRLTIKRRVEVARINIAACFPELDDTAQTELLKRGFRCTGQSVFDVGVASWSSVDRLERLVEIQGRERIDAIVASKRPVILLSPHFVSCGFGGLFLSQIMPVFAMYKAPRNPVFHAAYHHVCTTESTGVAVLDWITANGRSASPFGLVEHRAGLKPVIRNLRSGQHFYYLPDQDLGRRQTVFAPFFGVSTSTVAAGSRFAALTDAVVVPMAIWQKPRGRGYVLKFDEPLANYPGKDELSDATNMNQRIESLVRERPDQYFWLHKRFKSRPEGEARFYPKGL